MIPRPMRAGAALGALAVVLGLPGALVAQQAPFRSDVVQAGLLLRQLDGVKRVLMIGAHPDDEDTSLLTALARGMGVETAYLALNRGEGGQNLIGPELDEGLGVVRTGELLAARRLDGGQQFFTRAFDFGFSKSADETFANWDRNKLLGDVVWRIRAFRPQVVVSVFTGTPADGHGHHQVAGILAREAFQAAGDPTRFPEQLTEGVEAWQPAKLYQLARGGQPSTTVSTGTFDPLIGRSWLQLSMESRSQHRSQDMGVAQPPGPRVTALTLVGSNVDAPAGAGFFAGVDTALAALASHLDGPAARTASDQLARYRDDIHQAGAALTVLHPEAAAPALARALEPLARARAAAGSAGASGVSLARALDRKGELDRKALLAASGVTLSVTVDDGMVVPGESTGATVELWNGGPFTIDHATALLDLPQGWTATAAPVAPVRGGFGGRARPVGRDPGDVAASGTVAPGELARWRFTVTLPADAHLSRLYFLRQPRDGEMYRWPDDPSLWGLPKDPPPVHGEARFTLRVPDGGDTMAVAASPREAADHVDVDKATGEFHEPLLVVPAVSVGITPREMVWPLGLKEARTLAVTVQGEADKGVKGTLQVEAPAGWTVEPASVPFAFEGPDQQRTVQVTVRPPADMKEGRRQVRAVAVTDDGRRYAEALRVIDYPHIDRMAMFDSSTTNIQAVPVRVAQGLKVGYVMGSGDDGYDAIRQMGVDVQLLDPDRVRRGDFRGLDVVVLGVRAYETRPDLAAANQALLDFARQGGTVIVQYNKYEYPDGGFAPYPVTMARPHDRVTDQGAKVTLLRPNSPVFNTPNRITQEDFQGWVQDRGLYFLHTWDPHYVPLLEMADPGEQPLKGGLVVTPLGKGIYVYTGLAFFRQFPEGVPGAYRLFANLLSLNAASWSRAAEAGAGR